MTSEEKKHYILVGEDDKYYANIFKLKLSKEGFDVTVATDGRQVIEEMHTRKPDLILLDLIMPVQDGFETLKQIKEDKNMHDIPVVVFSNLGQEEDTVKAKKLGAVDHVVKADVSVQEMVERVRKYIK